MSGRCGTTRCAGCREVALLTENEALRATIAAIRKILGPPPPDPLDAVRSDYARLDARNVANRLGRDRS